MPSSRSTASCSTVTVPDDPYLGRELAAISRRRCAKRYPDALGAAPAAARDHRDAARQFDDQPRRASLVVRIADQTGAAPAAIAAAFAAVRNSYDMIALNSEINALDNKISGKVQLDLYAAVQDLLLDRLVWFLRNVDLTKGLADVVEHYRDGIATGRRRARRVLCRKPAAGARDGARSGAWSRPACRKRWRAASASLPRAHGRARHRAGGRPHRQAGRRSRRDLFRGRGVLPARPRHRCGARTSSCPTISIAWRSTARSIRSAMPSAGSPPRWSATVAPGRRRRSMGPPAQAEVERIRAAIHEIAGSGPHAVEAHGGGELAGRSGPAARED